MKALKSSFIQAISKDPTKESKLMSISEICDNIECNKIALPIFQTDIRWTKAKMADLLDFQLTGFAPVSPISMCYFEFDNMPGDQKEQIIGTHIKLISRELWKNYNSNFYSLTDGQQRITTNYKCYIGSEEVSRIVIDLVKGKIRLLNSEDDMKDTYIPVGKIFNKDINQLLKYKESNPFLEKIYDYLLIIRNKFMGYRYTINQAKNLNQADQLIWFKKLNSAGTLISNDDMDLIQVKLNGIEIVSEFSTPLKDLLAKYDYDQYMYKQKEKTSFPLCSLIPALDKATIGKCVTAPFSSNKNTKRFSKCDNPDLIRKLFSDTLKAMEIVLCFISENKLNIKSRLEYISYMVGYVISNEISTLSEDDKKYLVNWVNSTDFKNKVNTEKRNIYTELITHQNIAINV